MKTEHRFAEALRTLMSEVPLDDISVTILCKKCGVNRQTFYYHFHDIYDLLTLVFLDESIPDIEKTTDIKSLLKCIFTYYQNNAKFIDATLASAGKDLLKEFIYNTCYKSILGFINVMPDAKKANASDRKNLARFYALAYSDSVVYYLSNYKTKSFSGMMLCFAFQSEKVLEESLQNLIRFRGKGLK